MSSTELPMEFTRFGKAGIHSSKVILGMMSYGSSQWLDWVLNEAESLPLIKTAYDAGIRTFDTANIYSNGESEKVVASFMKKYKIPRNKVVLLTKCYGFVGYSPDMKMFGSVNKSGEYANEAGLSRKHIFDAVDASLKRLEMDYIDVLQIHRLDPDTSGEEIMEALHDIVKSGRVRYIGASSMYAWEFAELQHIADKHGWTKFINMQNCHSLLYREEEREMIPYCRATGVATTPWDVVAAGVLARPWDDAKSTVRGKSSDRHTEDDVNKKINQRVEEVAKKMGATMAQVAIAWSIAKGNIPLVGINKKERVEDACKAAKLRLSPEDITYMEEPYQPKAVIGIGR